MIFTNFIKKIIKSILSMIRAVFGIVCITIISFALAIIFAVSCSVCYIGEIGKKPTVKDKRKESEQTTYDDRGNIISLDSRRDKR